MHPENYATSSISYLMSLLTAQIRLFLMKLAHHLKITHCFITSLYAVGSQIKQFLVRLVLALFAEEETQRCEAACSAEAPFLGQKNSWKSSSIQLRVFFCFLFLLGTSCYPQTFCLAYAGPLGGLIDMINLNSLLSGCWILTKQACFKSSRLTLRSCD